LRERRTFTGQNGAEAPKGWFSPQREEGEMKIAGTFFLLLLLVTFLVQVVTYLNYKKHKKD
jgi:hypothetical protein